MAKTPQTILHGLFGNFGTRIREITEKRSIMRIFFPSLLLRGIPELQSLTGTI